MDDYVRYLIIVGAIILVITLILFNIMFSYSETSNTWPPEETPCPDYWKTTRDTDGGIECEDIFHLTSRDDSNKSLTYDEANNKRYTWGIDGPDEPPSVISRGELLSEETYEAGSGLWKTHCGKKIWAQHNGISWDGITNSNIPCTDSGYLLSPDNIYTDFINKVT
jgi:hypothetical protein